MAGEHILKLLLEENTRIGLGDRWLVCGQGAPIIYHVFECKPYQKKTRIIIETEDEELACRFLKGG